VEFSYASQSQKNPEEPRFPVNCGKKDEQWNKKSANSARHAAATAGYGMGVESA
jgi:hypothetical protein